MKITEETNKIKSQESLIRSQFFITEQILTLLKSSVLLKHTYTYIFIHPCLNLDFTRPPPTSEVKLQRL